MWLQKNIQIDQKSRGFHIITDEIIHQIPEIQNIKVGVLHLFIKHTSASITINENADPTVLIDFESHFNEAVPENAPYYRHTIEGPDDMPAHLKSTIIGNTLSIPISSGQLNIGVWQGIYLCEHRSQVHRRKIVATIYGELG